MTVQDRKVAIGVFESSQEARRAVDELHKAGFTDNEIGIASRSDDNTLASREESEGSKMGEGAMAGLATGAGVGGLWAIGIAAGFLPAIGPAIAGGILGSILTSAAAGAAAAGLVGALIGLGIPEDEAKHYDEQFRSGKTIVTVRTANRFAEAQAILGRFGGQSRHDSNLAGGARTHGVAGHSTSHTAGAASGPMTSSPATSTGMHSGSSASDMHSSSVSASTSAHGRSHGEKTMQLREEELHVDKQKVETGAAHLRKEVVTEHKTIEVPVEREELVIERHAVSGHQPASGTLNDGEEIHIPIREEQVHVSKQPVVREEVSIGKRKVQDSKHVDASVKREELKVDTEGDVHRRS